MNNKVSIEDVMAWLQSKHTTMWGGNGWTVTKEDTCRQAADWFVSQINDLYDWKNNAQ
jgi:hypothetical protein